LIAFGNNKKAVLIGRKGGVWFFRKISGRKGFLIGKSRPP